MQLSKHLALILALAFAVAGCQTKPADLPPAPEPPAVISDKPICTSCGFLLEKDQLESFEQQASGGNSEAAFRLALHYADAENSELEAHWMLYAAELGHPIAQYNVWHALQDSTSCADRRKALYWLNKSADSGNKDSDRELPGFRELASHCQEEPE